MKKKMMFIFLGLLILFILMAIGVYATTRITDNTISVNNLNISSINGNSEFILSRGNFDHKPGRFDELFCLRDNESGGTAPYFAGPRDVFVVGKYAYVVSLYNNSLVVVDISNPYNLTEVGFIADDSVGGTAEKLATPKSVFVSGDYAYIASNGDAALSIIDISNPSNMTEVGYINGSANYLNKPLSVYVYGGYAYISTGSVATGGSNSFVIIDVKNPENPNFISNLTGNASNHISNPGGFVISGDYAYIANHDSYYLSVVDISNVSNPHIISEIADDSIGGNFEALRDISQNAVTVSGRYLYTASSSEDAISIIDISNPFNLTEVVVIKDDSVGGIASVLDNPKKIFIAGKYMYTSSITDDAFSVFDISDINNIVEKGYIQDDNKGGDAECLDNPQGIFISGKYAYVTARNDNGLSVIDITGIDTPSINTGNIQANALNIIDFVNIAGDLFVMETLNIGSNAWFGKSVSILKNLDVFGDLTIKGETGITGNYTNGNCWTAYSGGIIYETNCTSA